MGTSADVYFWSLHIRYWMLVVVFAVLPLVRTIPLRRRFLKRRASRRSRRGQCGRCGYDLRATPLQCPECGTAAMPQASSRFERPWVRSYRVVCVAAAILGISTIAFARFQTARVAQALAESREDEIDDVAEKMERSMRWFADPQCRLTKVMRGYMNQTMMVGLQRLQQGRNLDHPWLASATICWRLDYTGEIRLAIVEHPNDADEVKIEIMDGDQSLGAFSCNRKIFNRESPAISASAPVQWVEDAPAADSNGDAIRLPRQLLTHPLRIRLAGSPDAEAIPLFVDPLLKAFPIRDQQDGRDAAPR